MKPKRPSMNPCWEKETRTPAVCYELSSNDLLVLPYVILRYARLEVSDKREVLRACYNGCTVEIEGKELRKLLQAIQKQELHTVRPSLGSRRGQFSSVELTVHQIRAELDGSESEFS